MPNELRILMIPADQTRNANPYNWLFNESLRHQGAIILSGSDRREAFSPADILHVHWPHNFASATPFRVAVIRSLILIFGCAYQKFRGAKIVWTVHDIESLTVLYPLFERLVMRTFTRMTDGLVVLNEETTAELFDRYPWLRRKRRISIPHGLFGDVYPPTASISEARKAAGIDIDRFVVSVPGDIKPYKRLEDLLAILTRVECSPQFSGLTLLIGGKVSEKSYAELIDQHLRMVSACGVEVIRLDRRLSEVEMATCIDLADVVALPYGKSFNSAVAILALERGRRVLGSKQPAFASLEREAGSFWVRNCDKDEYAEYLTSFKREQPDEGEKSALAGFMSRRSWVDGARRMIKFYYELCQQ